jgi:glycogen synthase
VVVGEAGVEGNAEPLLRRLSQEFGVEDRVSLVGSRPHQEVAQWLAAADVFCLASSNEGMANVILESLACGVPVVATRVGGNAELIREGENGYLVNLGDQEALASALVRALNTPWNRAEIANRIRPRSWEATATQVLEEFRSMMPMLGTETQPKDVSPGDLNCPASGHSGKPLKNNVSLELEAKVYRSTHNKKFSSTDML